jgi:hypothetical protein
MHPEAIAPRAGSSQGRLPLWLGAVLMLALLLVAPLASSHAGEPADQAAPASLQFASGEASPSDLPHCHHGHGTRHPAGALPRVERQDIDVNMPPVSCRSLDPTPSIIASTGAPHALPDPSPVPVYLLTQRFRS